MTEKAQYSNKMAEALPKAIEVATSDEDSDDNIDKTWTQDDSKRIGYITHTMTPKDLKPGDHIYCYRAANIYSHHGIYIGENDCEVIHFSSSNVLNGLMDFTLTSIERNMQWNADKLRAYDPSFTMSITMYPIDGKEKGKPIPATSVAELSAQRKKAIVDRSIEVQSTSLSKFCSGAKVRLVSYGASEVAKTIKKRPSCHVVESMLPTEVVKVAKYFCKHPKEWEDYNLLGDNNCETFACFCKTGLLDVAAQGQRKRDRAYEKTKTPCKTFDEALKNYQQAKTQSQSEDKSKATSLAKLQFDEDSDESDDDTAMTNTAPVDSERVGYVSHTIKPEYLKPGDHIYCYGPANLFRQHGIYIGKQGCEVIFCCTDALNGFVDVSLSAIERRLGKQMETLKSLNPNFSIDITLSNPEQKGEILTITNFSEISAYRKKAITKSKTEIQSCSLSEFCRENKIRLVSYSASHVAKKIKKRYSCHIVESMPPTEVIKVAKYFFLNPDEWRDFEGDKSESFAYFCKTGLLDLAIQDSSESGKTKSSCKTFEETMTNYRRQI